MYIFKRHYIIYYAIFLFFLFQGCHQPGKKKIIHAWEQSGTPVNLVIEYPRNETLFPPEITAPTVIWKESIEKSTLWLILVEFFNEDKPIIEFAEETTWQPDPEQWERIKANSTDTLVKITILGVRPKYPGKILSAASINIQISTDEVGAPIFFRDVPLPFIYAVENLDEIKWRFGNIDRSEPPPVVLENLPICENCHSFTRDGNTLAMDIDYANDKGSYVITDLEKHMPIIKDKIITWSDYRREDGENTFGLLSQISPDGRYVLSTVKDRSIFVPIDDLYYSQLFFPIKGIYLSNEDEYKDFQSAYVVYHDDFADYSTNEPTMDGTASLIYYQLSNC